jgi:ribosomal protein S6--L-glutamate ligase
MKLLIITAEPTNFVPVQLRLKAQEAKLDVEIIDITKTFLVATTASPKVMYLQGEDIVELPTDVAVIPRLNEHNLLYKLNVLKQLELGGAWMMNSVASMELCNDKLASQVLMNSERIQTPDSYIVSSADMLDHAIKTRGDRYPVIIKTLRGTHGIGVMKVDSESSLRSVAQACISHGIELMIQDFISHEESYRIIMTGSKLLAANRRGQPKEKNEFRTNAHLGSDTEKYEPGAEEIAIAQKLVELFGCNFCAIDYIKDGEKLIVLEVNGSPGLENIQGNYGDEKNLAGDVIAFVQEHIGAAETPLDSVASVSLNVPSSEITDTPERPPLHPAVGVIAQVQAGSTTPLGDVERVQVVRLADEGLEARVDTGAAYCSLHCEQVHEEEYVVRFKRGNITFKVPIARYIKIRNANGVTRRAVIKLDVMVRGVRYNQVEMTIAQRGSMRYEMLLGRNLLSLLGLPVLVPADDTRDTDLPPAEVEEE